MPKNPLLTMHSTRLTTLLTVLLSSSLTVRAVNLRAGWKRDPTRLDRMPISFGKRNSVPSTQEEPSPDNDVSDKVGKDYPMMDVAPGKRNRLMWQQGVSRRKGGALGDKRLAVLDRMPLSYGKRQYGSDLPNTFEQGANGEMGNRQTLYRLTLPIHFQSARPSQVRVGNRPSVSGLSPFMPYQSPLLLQAGSNAGLVDKRTILDRMPINFGKRGLTIASTDMANKDEDTRENHYFADPSKRQVIFGRMSLRPGRTSLNLNRLQGQDLASRSSNKQALSALTSDTARPERQRPAETYVADKGILHHRLPFNYGRWISQWNLTPAKGKRSWKTQHLFDRAPYSFSTRSYLGRPHRFPGGKM